MARFFALTSRGLLEVLEAELKEIGIENTLKGYGGVQFESSWSGCYRANLRSRIATRILLPILDFPAYKNEDLYNNIRRHDFTKYIDVSAALAVDARVRESVFTDQRFVAMKIKDAIVDQFRDKFGERPDVDTANPDLSIVARAVKNNFSISVDTTGEPLFKRGYRVAQVEAHLKENVAAGILRMTEWNKKIPIVDPMCGSGTFLIEAALMALNVSPGSLRKKFAFQKLTGFKREEWDREVSTALDEEAEDLDFKFYGFDVDKKALESARKNAEYAGVGHLIEFERSPMETLKAPCENGMVIVNPPYGERLGNKFDLLETYKNLAHTLKTAFKGWECYALSGDPELSAAMRLKAERKFPVYNGPIECRLLKYKMF